MLNRDDYPGLTDEQWDALNVTVNAEIDRERTKASNTARENARKGYVPEADKQAAIDAALDAERERAKMDAAQILDADRKAFEAREKAFAAEQRTFKARTKLVEAKLPADKIETLLPLFAGVDDKALDTTLDTFITTYQDGVKAQVDEAKIALLGGATPPKGSTTAQTDAASAAVKLAQSGDDAGAAQVLLAEAGLV